jgi:pantetheine-phosphate adenylyltransferase
MEKITVYPGTFDPITNGHIDLIRRGSRLFDRIIVLVAERKEKNTLFTLEERIELVRSSIKNFKNVSIEPLSRLLTDYLRENNIHFILRGLRAVSDFDYELQMALMNRELLKDCETIFIMGSKEEIFLSSNLIREIATNRGDISPFVPKCVKLKVDSKLRRK